MSSGPIIVNRAALDSVLADLRPTVDFSARLPESPFRRPGIDSVCEFERFRAGSFGPLLGALAGIYGDKYVCGLSVDPDPEYFAEWYETFGAFRIPVPEISSEYWEALSFQPGDDVTGALLFAAEVFCVGGSSGRWVIWGERPIGAAIVHTEIADSSWRRDVDFFVTPQEALSDFVEPNFNREPLSQEFRQRFLSNFDFDGVEGAS